MKTNNKKWYSVIIAVLMVWFMLILSLWVFSLILKESKDTKMMESYLKAYQAAEWGVELALLEAKVNNYNLSVNENSEVFKSSTSLNPIKDPKLNYKIESQTNKLEDKQIVSWKFHIVPLSRVNKFKLESNNPQKLVWNIIWEKKWISWVWNIDNLTNWNLKTISNTFDIALNESKNVYDFLSSNNEEDKYLILNNLDTTNSIKYNLVSLNAEKFVKDKTQIISSAEVNWFKQNLRVEVNNLEYLNLLKYSIYSPN